MDSDVRMQQYLLLAKSARGRAVVELINKATSDSGVFGFGELLQTPSVAELQSGELSSHYTFLELYAYGAWPDYQANASHLPAVNEQQKLKLKQLTVVNLAMKDKVIPYTILQQHLEIATIRELEDFVITDCFYPGVIKGKLDQNQACLQVHDAIGRDIKPDSLPELAQHLSAWMHTSEDLLHAIEQRVQSATAASEAAKKHREEVEQRQEEVKKQVRTESRDSDTAMLDMGFDYMDEDRMEGDPRGPADRGERAPGRPKRRR